MTMAVQSLRRRPLSIFLGIFYTSIFLHSLSAVDATFVDATIDDFGTQKCTLRSDGACVEDVGEQERVLKEVDGLVETGFGEAQMVQGAEADLTRQVIRNMLDYMERSVLYNESLPAHVRVGCSNKHELCAFWAAVGECQANPEFLTMQCAPACLSCNKLSFEERCPMPENVEELDIWKPHHGLNAAFGRIVNDPAFADQGLKIWSKPGIFKSNLRGDLPWIISIDDFLTEEECKALIGLANEQGFEPVKDLGNIQYDGTYAYVESDAKTSMNAWCLADSCVNDFITTEVMEKIEQITGIPDENSEYLQFLKFEETHFSSLHHDYSKMHLERAHGPRILTAYIFLSDVPEGGALNFPQLDHVKIQPKRGRIVLWPSVKEEDPNTKEIRTVYHVEPVVKGTLYAANAWLHLRDFKAPYSVGCV